jgi:hypothetical protein
LFELTAKNHPVHTVSLVFTATEARPLLVKLAFPGSAQAHDKNHSLACNDLLLFRSVG